MPKATGSIREFVAELRRRRVYRVAIVYAAVAFVIWQVADISFPGLGIPRIGVTIVLVVTLLGFPVALVLAWAYDVSPHAAAGPTKHETRNPGPSDPVLAAASKPQRPPAVEGSIAILPFQNMSAEEGSEYFADGISEELTHTLGRMPALRVAARTSAFSFKGSQIDVREIGARLNVAHIVEGSVRRSGNRLRVTAQLIDTKNGYHVWSDRFEREPGDVFEIQDDIVDAVVASLMQRLALASESRTPTLIRTEDLGAYDLYLRGRHELRAFDGPSVERAVMLLERAIGLDPRFAPAFAALAEALMTQAIGFLQGAGAEVMRRARDAAEQALALDPSLPEAHVAKGLAHLYHDWSYKAAKAELDEAARLNPSHVDAYRWAEFYWTYVEYDYEHAKAALAKARSLDPLDPRLLVREGVVAFAFGHFAQAERIFRELLASDAPRVIGLIGLMETLHRAGRRTEAIAVARQLPVDSDVPHVGIAVSGALLAQCGAEDEARRRLHVLESRCEPGDPLPFWRAAIHAGLGEMDEAFRLFDEAVSMRDAALLYLIVLPPRPGFQSDPRFGKLLRAIGLGHLTAVAVQTTPTR
jgi:TolB-like protein/tetratricopeptide (TPR) repeat protein